MIAERKFRLPLFADVSRGYWITLLVAALVVTVLPKILSDPYFILMMQTIGYYFIVVVGLNILVGFTGQISLGHVGLFAAGGYTSALLAVRWGWPFWITALCGIVVAALFGVLLALPSLRVKGPYLAMVTLGFGFVVEVAAQRWTWLTAGPTGIFGVPKPALFGFKFDSVAYFYLIGFTALLAQVFATNLMRSRWGRTFLALRSSEVAAETVGINVYKWKVAAFVISAAYAGVGGVFFAHQTGYINSDTFVFSLSVTFLAAVILGGTGTLLGPLIGTLLVEVIPQAFAVVEEYRLLIFGGALLAFAALLPEGIVGSLGKLEFFQRRRLLAPPQVALPELPRFGAAVAPDKPLLQAQGLCKAFGGLMAVDEINLQVMPGAIHALIGPNGSGKSTFINVVTGIYRPTGGKVVFRDQLVNSLPPHEMSRRGVTRTFQTVRLFGDLSVLDNVLVGYHNHLRAGFLGHLLRTKATAQEEQRFCQRALALLAFVGIADKAYEEARNLSYGMQRMVEIARALATSPNLLFLDEPAAGVNSGELHQVSRVIKTVRDAGVTIVVVEHHVELVMNVSDVVTVLDFGRKIAEGRPAEVQRDKKVIEAYLGDQEVYSNAPESK